MKKGWKIFAIVCAVATGIGITLCVAGFALGVSIQETRDAFDRGVGFGPYFNYKHHTEIVTEKMDHDASKLSFHNIRNIKLDVGVVQVEVIPTDEDVIRVEHDVDSRLKIRCTQDGDTLKIKTAGRIPKNNHSGTVQVYLPRNLILDEADFSIGAGALKVTDFEANELNIECGAATVHMANVSADDVSIECGAGQIKYVSRGQEQDYNYDVEIGAGEVRIGEGVYSGLAVDKKIDNNANKNMSIECGTGKVTVTFEQ